MSKYIGDFGVDPVLFGLVLRTFISVDGVEWAPDCVSVFDGLQNVLDKCLAWYEERVSAGIATKLLEDDSRDSSNTTRLPEVLVRSEQPKDPLALLATLPDSFQIVEAEPITDRKSSFVGRACRISHPAQVPGPWSIAW